MTMSEQLPLGGLENLDPSLISSAEASRANRSHSWVHVEVPLTNGGAGRGSLTSFAQYDPATSSWKTSQHSFEILSPSDGSSVTWPSSGSMRTGRCYPRAPWVHHTHARECFYWPTPRAMMAAIPVRIRNRREGYGENLEERVGRREGITESNGYLNPRWIEWLMGFPVTWCTTSSTPSETLSSPQ